MSDEVDQSISYECGAQYWDKIPPTIDGMLGGFGQISGTDIEGSSKFIKMVFKGEDPPGKVRALDCGAGIGRITKHLLQRFFDKVDLVEQNEKFISQAPEYLGDQSKLGDLFCKGLQDFTPEEGKYDVIWCQWVLGHLPDHDLVQFFQRSVLGLKPHGMIIVKENITSSGEVELDREDSSVTRPDPVFRKIFHDANLDIVEDLRQRKFPDGLYPVHMYALRPKVFNSPLINQP